jgi:type I site-specific restriction endonuclease
MRRIHHLKELIENIKKTEEMISLHKEDELGLMSAQYETLKAKQVAEFIDELAKPPFQSVESFSLIKLMINKYYPFDKLEQKELKELALAI